MKTYLILLLFLLSSSLMFCQIKGQWRQVFPENPPGPRYNQYMCPIGDQKVLMIGGHGGGNPYHYSNETWLYDYPSNTWTRVQCDTTPDTYPWTGEKGNFISQISKNRVIAPGEEIIMMPYGPQQVVRYWLFDLDSMKWFRLHDSIKLGDRITYLLAEVYLEENLMFNYEVVYQKKGGLSWLIRLHPEEPLDSPNLITKELINDELITKQGPNYNYPNFTDIFDPKYFTHNNNYKNITYIPLFLGKAWEELECSFMDMKLSSPYEWLFIDKVTDTIPIAIKSTYSNITNNVTLLCYASNTYSIEYSPETNLINTYKIDCDTRPAKMRGVPLSKLKNGVVMLFGGDPCDTCYLSNETWIFELESNVTEDNYNNPVKVYEIGDNVYLLDGEIKDASLYNLLGQKIMDYKDTRFNLNNFPIGAYFLHYTENNTERIIKLLKK